MPAAGIGKAPAVRRDVVTTFACFTLSGVFAGSWFSRIPAVRDHLDADLRTMGIVLLCFGLGSFCSMPFGGRLNLRFGSRAVCTTSAVVTCVVMPVLTFVTDAVVFGAVLFVAGAMFGMWEVTLNVHGAAVEKAGGTTIMSALHGFWSGGLILGSASGALLASHAVGLATHFVVVFPMLALLNGLAASYWRDYHPHQSDVSDDGAATASGKRARRLPIGPAVTVPIILIAAMTLCSNVGEGSASDWLALYVHDERGFAAGSAAAVYTVYTVALTIGRLGGSFVIGRLGRVRTLRIAGIVSAIGVGITLTLPGGAGPFIGAGVWGLGLAVVFPAAISAASDHGGDNAAGAIAAVSTMAYGAFLVGPPLIGLLAQSLSIGAALRVVLVLALGISVLAFAAAPPRKPRTPAHADAGVDGAGAAGQPVGVTTPAGN
ncbi:MAG TPA: MFS transporter [Actinopolymorphaceae bacterium]